jgi:hypothetical protein
MRTAVSLLAVLLFTTAHARAQDTTSTSPGVVAAAEPRQTADSIFVVERGTPEVNTWDIVELPFHVLQAPFWFLGKVVSGVAVTAERSNLHLVLPTWVRELSAIGVYPQVTGQGKTSGLGAGILFGRRARPQRLWGYVRGGVTTREYWGLGLTAGYGGAEPRQSPGKPKGTATTRPPRLLGGSRFGVIGFAQASYRAQDNFYGIGPDSRQEDRSDYDLERYLAGGELYVRVAPRLILELDGRWERDQAGSGNDQLLPGVDESFSSEDIPGFGRQETQLVFGGNLEWRVGTPRTARRVNHWLDLGYHWNASRTDGAADIGHLTGSAGVEIPLDRRRLSLFFALEFESVRPSGEGEIAFYELPALGGRGQLPAYRAFRFRDRDLLLGKAEYHWRVWCDQLDTLWLDAALVLYGGKVAHSMGQDFRLSDLRESYGLNFALITQSTEIARIELANGDEGFRVTLSFGATI